MSTEQTVCHIHDMVLTFGFSNVNEDPSLSGEPVLSHISLVFYGILTA